mgnify:CR=1 FL=1
MRAAWGALVLAFALAGCGGPVKIVDNVAVDNVPACLTWPIPLAGDVYYEMREEDVEAWIESHEDPYGGTPQPQASAAWDDLNDGIGRLYRYEDGTALFIAATGRKIYFTDEERDFGAVC